MIPIAKAPAVGAHLPCGGKPARVRDVGGGGLSPKPAVLANVLEDAAWMREETFAPAAPLCPFDTEEQVLRQANKSYCGLARSPDHLQELKETAQRMR